jgi:hypothetical protein
MKNENVAILIFACDRYELLFKGFDHFFKKNWDNSIFLKKYFSTEKKDIGIEGYIHLKSGYGEWTDRLKKVLNQIEEDYIIFMQEDMWFSKNAPERVLAQILLYIQENDLKLVKLHSSEVYKTKELNIDFSGFRLSEVVKQESNFLMSHQVSIWDKKFLYNQLKKHEHPWRNERRGSKRLKKIKDRIYQIDLLSENGKMPINENSLSIEQGEYLTISANACIHPKVEIFINELKNEFPEYAQKLEFNMKNKITHDGMEKPRKEDLFKKMKNKIHLLTLHNKS